MLIEADADARRSVIKGLLDRCRRAVARRSQFRRRDCLGMKAVSRELELSEAELRALTFELLGSLRSLSTHVSRVGLSEDELAAVRGKVLHDMRRVCCQCQSKARCASDLRHEWRASPAKYCPNGRALRALADEAHQGASRVLPFPS